jgi:hypothetical protein
VEFKRNNEHSERTRIKVPDRGASNNVPPSRSPYGSSATKNKEIPKDLKSQRKSLGFNDIPTTDDDMEHVRFRDILRAWAKQAIKNSPIEKRVQDAKVKKDRLHGLKNDLKWALQADLDEPVKPRGKDPEHHPAKPIQSDSKSAAHDSGKTIDININFGSLPKLPPLTKIKPIIRKLVTKIQKFRWTQRRIIAAVAVVVIISAGISAWNFIPGIQGSKKGSGISASSQGAQTPDYKTTLPKGKSIDALGGWHRVSPPNGNPVFAYADKIDGVSISVSQQPLPESFYPDVDDQVANLAKGFSATDKFDADGTDIYVGTSAKGPQSVILAKKDMLILIKSTAKISDDSWAKYVQSLN